jgi:biotin carboxyl carrier protein
VIYEVTIQGKTRRVELLRTGSGWELKLDGKVFPADVGFPQPGVLSILVDGESYEVKQQAAGGETSIVIGQERFSVVVRDPRSLASRRRADDDGHGVRKITAPMPGKVVRIVAPAGTAVESGQAVLVIEAMKMQNELKSPKKGTVKKLNVSEGAAVEAGQVLAEVE